MASLTGIGLQQRLRLSQHLLSPVLGGIGPTDQVLQVRIQLSLLSLAQFLLCELGRPERCVNILCYMSAKHLYHTGLILTCTQEYKKKHGVSCGRHRSVHVGACVDQLQGQTDCAEEASEEASWWNHVVVPTLDSSHQ